MDYVLTESQFNKVMGYFELSLKVISDDEIMSLLRQDMEILKMLKEIKDGQARRLGSADA